MTRRALSAALAFALAAPAAARTAWIRGPEMGTARNEASGAYADGRFYVIGGARSAECFDPATGEWTPTAPPPIDRGQAQAAVVDGIIYVFGGCVALDCSNVPSANWAYDPATNEWTPRAPMRTARFGAQVGVIGGKIYVAGGDVPFWTPTSVLEVYDPDSNTWSERAPMPRARAYGGYGVANGKLYVFGGTDNRAYQKSQPHAETMVYDPETDSWSGAAPLPTPLTGAASASLGRKTYLLGGSGRSQVAGTSTWVYDSSADSWSAGPELNDARDIAAAAGGDGVLYVAGSINGNVQSTSFEYAVVSGRPPRRAPANERRPTAIAAAPPRRLPRAPRVEPGRAAPLRRAALRPHDYALVIGIDEYSILPEARFAENDADSMKKRLLALGYPERNIILLKGGRATHGAIQGYVEEWLPRNVHPDSRVFVYFSGHGSPDPKNGDAYLVPWDGDAMFLKSTAYPLKSLYASLGRLKVKHVVVALDSCFSGAGGRSVLVAGARPLVFRVDQAGAPTGVTVLAAASGDEITGTIDAREHGAFTYYLLKALDDGKRTAKAAFEELEPNVEDEAHRENREQTPLMLGSDAPF